MLSKCHKDGNLSSNCGGRAGGERRVREGVFTGREDNTVIHCVCVCVCVHVFKYLNPTCTGTVPEGQIKQTAIQI